MAATAPFRVSVGSKRPAAGSSAAALSASFQASLKEVLGNLNAFINHVDGATPQILEDTLRPTFAKSLIYCPIQTGELRNSGYLETRKLTRGAEVEMGYGRGGHPDYAISVHELPRYHEPPTRDKFLQGAIDEDYFDIIGSLPQRIREVAGT